MKCPNCGIDNNDSQVYCSSCGTSLFGPRSINLNSIGNESDNIKANDIKKITGIDINDLPIGHEAVTTPVKKKKEVHVNVPVTILSIVTVILLILCTVQLIFLKKDNKTVLSDNTECKKCNNSIEGIYGISSNFTFYLPSDWIYSESSNETIITNNDVSILVYGSNEGQVDRITAEKIKKQYQEDGFNDAVVREEVLNQRKIMYVTFNSNNIYFADFYYQYDSEKFIYGQMSSKSNEDFIDEDIKNILASLQLETRKNFQVVKAPVTYSSLFELIK